MPLIGELFCDRGQTCGQKLETDTPMAETGKTHDCPLPDPQQALNQPRWFIDLLQRLTHYYVIKGIIRIIPYFFINVTLDHGEPPLDTVGYLGFDALDPCANYLLVFLKKV